MVPINSSFGKANGGAGIKNYHLKARSIPSFSLGGGYELVPYEDSKEMLEALQSIVNDPKVYPFMRHGEPWPLQMVIERHRAYGTENAQYLREGGSSPENLSVTWALRAPNKVIIGRGAIQPGESIPVVSEIMFTIKGDYQGKGMGKKAFGTLTKWFFSTYPNRNLRWLTTEKNFISRKLAKELKFVPVLKEDGTQLAEVNWGIKYLIFERKGNKSSKK